MKIPIAPIITMAVTLLLGGTALFFLKKDKKSNKDIEKEKIKVQETVQDFVNVKDIRGKFLYTKDNRVFCYIRIYPIDINLFSRKEKKSKTNTLTKEISAVLEEPLKFLAISKPTDISSLLEEYQEILTTSTDQNQKELLRKEMLSLGDYTTSGEAMERQFYIPLWHDEEDRAETELEKIANDYISAFNSIGIKAEILGEKGIYQLCNLFSNPNYTNEEINFDMTVPILSKEGA
mgnify:FL=1